MSNSKNFQLNKNIIKCIDILLYSYWVGSHSTVRLTLLVSLTLFLSYTLHISFLVLCGLFVFSRLVFKKHKEKSREWRIWRTARWERLRLLVTYLHHLMERIWSRFVRSSGNWKAERWTIIIKVRYVETLSNTDIPLCFGRSPVLSSQLQLSEQLLHHCPL